MPASIYSSSPFLALSAFMKHVPYVFVGMIPYFVGIYLVSLCRSLGMALLAAFTATLLTALLVAVATALLAYISSSVTVALAGKAVAYDLNSLLLSRLSATTVAVEAVKPIVLSLFCYWLFVRRRAAA
jgi:hypothetical protein